jgi:hypothetical protein
MRIRLAVILILSGIGLPACDLQHLPERIQCWQADDDWQACRELKGICTPDGGPQCVGAEDSACAWACRPSEDASSCVVHFEDEGSCGGQGIVSNLGVFNGPRHEGGWKTLPLERGLWEARVGVELDAELVASMTPRQRRAVCATTRTLDSTGRSPCRLEWNELRDHATCERLAEPCAECDLVVSEFRCLPRNLCSGVICF